MTVLVPVSKSSYLFLLGLITAAFSNFGVSTSHITLAQISLYELEPKPKGLLPEAANNKLIRLVIGGMMLAQLLMFLSIYISPLYAVWVKPHLWTFLLWPYMLRYGYRMLTASKPMRFEKPSYTYNDPDIEVNLFLDGFLGQLMNPIIWPTPIFSRLFSTMVFRHSHTSMFLSGVAIGWCGGYAGLLLMTCMLIYALYYVPGSVNSYTYWLYRFFKPLGLLVFIASTTVCYRTVIEINYPLLEADTMRFKPGWPNLFFDANTYRRPLLLPSIHWHDTELVSAKHNKEGQEQISQGQEQISQGQEQIPQGQEQIPQGQQTNQTLIEAEAKTETSKVVFNFIPKNRLVQYKRLGTYFFNNCIDLGNQRLSHNYLPSLAAAHAILTELIDYPNLTLKTSTDIQNEWLVSLINRRHRITQALSKRLKMVNSYQQHFASIVQKPVQTKYSPIYFQDKVNPKVLLELTSIDEDIELQTSRDPRLMLLSLGQHLPDKTFIDPFYDFSIQLQNSLYTWLEDKAKLKKITAILPWSRLGMERSQLLPIILNNQTKNYSIETLPSMSWVEFIMEHKEPLLPHYLVRQEDATTSIEKLTYQRHAINILLYIAKVLQTTAQKQLNLLPNLSKEEKEIRWLVELQHILPLYSMSHVTEEGEPAGVVINEQPPSNADVSIGGGVKPVGPRLNQHLDIPFDIPRKAHGGIGKLIRQKRIKSISSAYSRAAQQQDTLPENYINVHPILPWKYINFYALFNPKEQDVSKPLVQKLVKFLATYNTQKTVNRKLFKFLGVYLQIFRGPLLLGQRYVRKYFLLPVLILSKEITLRILGLPSELGDDLEAWSREHYRICDYEGQELSKEIEASQGPKGKAKPSPQGKQSASLKPSKQQSKEPIQQPIQEPSKQPIQEPSKQPIQEPSKQPSKQPIQQTLDFAKKKKSEEDADQNNWDLPEKWWKDGLQIKIISPCRIVLFRQLLSHPEITTELRPMWLDKLRQTMPNLTNEDVSVIEHYIFKSTSQLTLKNTFLSLTGGEKVSPFGSLVRVPNHFNVVNSILLWRIYGFFRRLIRPILKSLIFQRIKSNCGWMIRYLDQRRIQLWEFKIKAEQSFKECQEIIQAMLMKLQQLKALLFPQAKPKPIDLVTLKEVSSPPGPVKLKPSYAKRIGILPPVRPRKFKKSVFPVRFPKVKKAIRRARFPQFKKAVFGKPKINTLFRFPLLEAFPERALRRSKISKREYGSFISLYKWSQVKLLGLRLRKSRKFIWKYITTFVKLELPIWIRLQIRLMPNRRRLWIHTFQSMCKRLIHILVDWVYSGKDNLITLYFIIRYGKQEFQEVSTGLMELQEELRREAEERRFTANSIWQGLYQSDLIFGPSYHAMMDRHKTNSYSLSDMMRQTVGSPTKGRFLRALYKYQLSLPNQHRLITNKIMKRTISFNLFKMFKRRARFVVPPYIWSMWKVPTTRKQRSLILKSVTKRVSQPSLFELPAGEQRRSAPLDALYAFVVNSAMNWGKLHQANHCVKVYMDPYSGIIPLTEKRHKKSFFATSTKSLPNISMLSLSDEETENYFDFNPDWELLNSEVKGAVVNALLFRVEPQCVWYDQERTALDYFNRWYQRFLPEVEKPSWSLEPAEKIKGDLANVEDSSFFINPAYDFDQFVLDGGDYQSRDTCVDCHGDMQLTRWRAKHLNETLFTYNFIGPLYEYVSRTHNQVHKKLFSLCLKKSVRFSCSSYESLLMPETRREYRILNLLRLYQDNQLIQPKLPRTQGKENRPFVRMLDRYLWSTYRFEDLACMNRFWFGTVNQSKLGLMRIRMYPLVKS